MTTNGYHILERNYRYLKAEVDIIAIKNNSLVAIEIKTRSSDLFGAPETFLKPQQQQRIV
ncbi:MAG: YraN family protein [Flavobacteriaceae bacterium]